MFLAIIFVVGMLGHLSNGVPLESPSTDFGQFFDQRIVGGSEAAEGQAPYMASLVVGYTWQALVCGSSIISKRCFLTAAHCILLNWDGGLLETFHAKVGSNGWYRGTVSEFKGHKIHPKYDHWNIKYDVALIFAKDDIELNERVAIIALDFNYVKGGEKSVVHGWGTQSLWGIIPNELQYLRLRTISYEECVEALNKAVGESGGWAPYIDKRLEICTFKSLGKGLCHGDSGSALVLILTNKQIGVVSWAIRTCAEGYPDVNASLFGAKDFILKNLKCAPHSCTDEKEDSVIFPEQNLLTHA